RARLVLADGAEPAALTSRVCREAPGSSRVTWIRAGVTATSAVGSRTRSPSSAIAEGGARAGAVEVPIAGRLRYASIRRRRRSSELGPASQSGRFLGHLGTS